MRPMKCPKCNTICAYGRDTDGDLTTIKVTCICLHNFTEDFIGYPNLFGTDDYYFEFIDEDAIKCGKRNEDKKKN